MSSTYGKNLKVTLFGESHGPAIGCVLDGFPANFSPDLEKVKAFMSRRAPSSQPGSTQRCESDAFEILSGLFNEKTCGTPITAVIKNSDAHSKDYSKLSDLMRPGHADYPMNVKTGGANDYRGGGHSSGRIMAGLCFSGALAIQYLESKGIEVKGRIVSIGSQKNEPNSNDILSPEAKAVIEAARAEGDSVGGVIECEITNLPVGLGEPIFDGVENRIAAAIFGIPAVKGIEFGSGFAGTTSKGSLNNDSFTVKDGKIETTTNNHGGSLGGMTSGMPTVFRVAIKPTPSISKPQKSVSLSKQTEEELVIEGRHDACIVPRALPVVEAMAALVALDLLLD
ncbi:chorismate synthase [bacterium]|nr:chorismate synthase [bacterium]